MTRPSRNGKMGHTETENGGWRPVRKLAWFSCGFALACLLSCYGAGGPLPALLCLATTALAFLLWRASRPRPGEHPDLSLLPKGRRRQFALSRRALAACLGGALAFGWFSAYSALFYAPATDLAGTEGVISGTVTSYPEATSIGGWSLTMTLEGGLHAPDVLLTIYGSGPLEAELKEYILSCKAEKNVVLAGRCSNMADALLENDLFVLSSDYEGMPNALLEAMALGMPCISTDCPTGPSEMIRNEESGILTPVQDSKMLEAAIMSVMKDSHRAYEMGQKARMFVLDQCVDTRVAEKFIRCTEPYCK